MHASPATGNHRFASDSSRVSAGMLARFQRFRRAVPDAGRDAGAPGFGSSDYSLEARAFSPANGR